MTMLIEYKNGRRKDVKGPMAKVLIARNLARAVEEAEASAGSEAADAAPSYRTRMLKAEPAAAKIPLQKADKPMAPYGYKADGTPRKRPAPKAKG